MGGLDAVQKMKRLGVFFVDIRNGIVDDYIIYLMKDMREILSCFCVVCNRKMTQKSLDELSQYADNIYICSNEGHDIAGYREVLTKYIGWEKVKVFDELVLFDDTFFGPFYSFKVVFETMEKRDIDFWGLLRKAASADLNWNHVPECLETSILVVKQKLLCSPAFKNFFEDMKNNSMYKFLDHFGQLGYTWDTYIDSSQYISERPQNNIECSRYLSFELIKNMKYPILSRKNFQFKDEDLNYAGGENLARTLKYIDENTDYDVNMIWDNVLRNYDINDIKNMLHIHYLLPSRVSYCHKNILKEKNIAIIMHLYYMDLLDECFEYIEDIPREIDIIITTPSGLNEELIIEKFQRINRKNYKILQAGMRGRDVAALLVACRPYLMKYEYLCFLHDKKTTGNAGAATIGKSFMYNMWENLLKNSLYIENIIYTLQQNPRLGFLSPPEPYHADHFHVMGNEWTNCFQKTRELTDKLRLRVKLSEDKGPFALSTSFWCRTSALKALFEYPFSYEDFPMEPLPLDGTLSHAIERIFIYVAQHEGYFSGIVENDEYASLHITNIQKMLSEFIGLMSEQHYFTRFNDLKKAIADDRLMEFCKKYQQVYIYGAGVFGQRMLKVLEKYPVEVKGFIISDGQKKPEISDQISCYYLSKVKVNEKCGIVIAVNKKAQGEILQTIRQYGYKNLYYL